MPSTTDRGHRQRGNESAPARLHLDWTRCDGHGSCAELLPELLDLDDWGFPVARSGVKEPGVPVDLLGNARRAVRACPLQALSLRHSAPVR